MFTGKRILITGATGGIGQALTLRLAQQQAALALVARSEEKLQALAQKTNGRIYPCDVSQLNQVEETAKRIFTDMGGIDIAIFAAGIGQMSDASAPDPLETSQMMAVNLLGVTNWLALLIPKMLQQGEGTLVAISSLSADRGLPGSAAYSASKSALTSFMESLRADLWRSPVKIITVEPGFVRTAMTENNGPMPFLVEPERATQIILSGIARGRERIRFPLPMSIITGMFRYLPTSLYCWIAQKLR